MTKIAGSGSISQRHGSAYPDPDPDPHQNVMDPQHWHLHYTVTTVHVLLRIGRNIPSEPLYSLSRPDDRSNNVYIYKFKYNVNGRYLQKSNCLNVGDTAFLTGSRIHERTISLRFLGIILRVLRLEVSVRIS
jgi:hypothetical protein